MKTPVSARSAILRALDKAGTELKASEIIRLLNNRGIDLKKGNIYPALNRLNTEGMVRHKTSTREDTGRECGFWSLTVKGRKLAGREREAVIKLYGE
jgi:DNA-binding PadR family transcriptional regulator